MHEQLATADVVQHKVDFVAGLEGEFERDEEGIGVGSQDLALGHRMLDFCT